MKTFSGLLFSYANNRWFLTLGQGQPLSNFRPAYPEVTPIIKLCTCAHVRWIRTRERYIPIKRKIRKTARCVQRVTSNTLWFEKGFRATTSRLEYGESFLPCTLHTRPEKRGNGETKRSTSRRRRRETVKRWRTNVGSGAKTAAAAAIGEGAMRKRRTSIYCTGGIERQFTIGYQDPRTLLGSRS